MLILQLAQVVAIMICQVKILTMHFGESLSTIIIKERIESVLYMTLIHMNIQVSNHLSPFYIPIKGI